MAIKAQCGSCGASFSAKDGLAGKRVKCPKCSAPMLIPGKALSVGKPQTSVSKPKPQTSLAVGGAAGHNPLLDLLDEAGVESVPRGPICQNCGTDMDVNAVICVGCGFNASTGVQLETETYDDPGESEEGSDLTDAEKIMAKAEREIDDMPVTAVGQDFGDGADSYLITVVCSIGLSILVAIGLAIIFLMDWFGDLIEPAWISFYASIGIYLLCTVWISIVAFLAKPVQGVICVCTGGLYCIIFGFMTTGLKMPAIVLSCSVLIGLVSYTFASMPKDEFSMQIQSMPSFLGQLITLLV